MLYLSGLLRYVERNFEAILINPNLHARTQTISRSLWPECVGLIEEMYCQFREQPQTLTESWRGFLSIDFTNWFLTEEAVAKDGSFVYIVLSL